MKRNIHVFVLSIYLVLGTTGRLFAQNMKDNNIIIGSTGGGSINEFRYPAITIDPNKSIDLTLEGGGTLGTSYCGSLMALARNHIWPKRVAGNSAGAITGCLIAAGYNANEIDYFFAPEGPVTRTPPSGITREVGPNYLNYTKFMDLSNIVNPSISNKKSTFLYKALEKFYDTKVTLPPIPNSNMDDMVKAILNQVPSSITIPDHDIEKKVCPPGFTSSPPCFQYSISRGSLGNININLPNLEAVKAAINANISELNNRTMTVGEVVTSATRETKEQHLERLFDLTTVALDPRYTFLLNFMVDGGFFNGDELYRRLKTLMDKKGITTFASLAAVDDFAVIATDVTNKKMKVFSKKLTPNADVPKAVRASMSLPFIFDRAKDPEPGGNNEYMDGGLCDNWPFWYHLTYTTKTIAQDSINERQRPKINIYLNSSGTSRQPFAQNCISKPTSPDACFFEMLQGPSSAQPPIELSIFKYLGIYSDFNMGTGRDEASMNMFDLLKRSNKDVPFIAVENFLPGLCWLDHCVDINDYNFAACKGWESIINVLKSSKELMGAGFNVVEENDPYNISFDLKTRPCELERLWPVAPPHRSSN